MNIKLTIFVFILATASAVAAIYTHNIDSRNDRRTNGVVLLLTSEQLPFDAITKITLKRNDVEPIVFSKGESGWSQSQPIAFKVDPFSLRQLLVQPLQVRVSDEIDISQINGSLSAKELALDPPCPPGTVQTNNQCVPDLSQTCGDGTVPEGNECVVDPSLIQDLEDTITDLEDALAAALANLAAALAQIIDLEFCLADDDNCDDDDDDRDDNDDDNDDDRDDRDDDD